MSSKLLLGFAAGLAVGMLFAPEKGTEIRKKIADKGNDLKDKFNDFVDSLSSKADEFVDEAQNFAGSTSTKPNYS